MRCCRSSHGVTTRRRLGGPKFGPTNFQMLQIVRESALSEAAPACLGGRGSLVRIQSPRSLSSEILTSRKEAADLRGTWLRRRSHRTADPAARLQPPGAVGGRGMNHAAWRHEFSVASKPGRRFQSVSSHPRMTPFSPHSGQCHRMSDEPGRSSAMMSPKQRLRPGRRQHGTFV